MSTAISRQEAIIVILILGIIEIICTGLIAIASQGLTIGDLLHSGQRKANAF
jgi:hypothetical protein